ncbi:related to mitochondrial Fe2+ transporter MMT1 and related transporters (cation diffusion facilitator superfamily) [Armillaria ostoyae]|uniref:Related to mitochondrial Fe2+ transporter MMT1 and related transporters (Cation diffusion facilitator superfamily) n=1 Tax=Armillaria ostoyae TaxID=47428 RepID=A0A284QSP3_ARMOS|nr:related to mitochondrial Fe2+ transporter MMT1 and related transporters (cation diffusion facilitator superfamily) [Armillaria ostoyae]
MSFARPKSSSSGNSPLTPPLSPSRSAPKVSDVESSLSDKPVDDPFRLRAALRDPDDVAALRRRWNPRKQRHIGKFYETQNEKIDAMLKTMESHAQEGEEGTKENALKVKIAVYASFIANCILSVLQLYAAISSLSLSFFATAADSVFDPAANLLLNQLHRKSKRVDFDKYPGGGARLTTIGNIVYSFAMLSVSILLVAFSIQDLTTHKDGETLDFNVPSVIAVGVAFVTKVLLFLYCFSIRNSSSQVQVLWEDHRNDLLINGFGILTSSAGAKLKWWIDPMGAIIISCVIIVSWTYTSYIQFGYLAGKAAPHEFTQLVIYKTLMFSDEIKQIDSCRAYHSGEKFLVEIVMPSDTPLWKSHDLSQDLQDKLETLPMVERAFVHVDHEVSHKPEHRKYI